jgi:hypothetical protein
LGRIAEINFISAFWTAQHSRVKASLLPNVIPRSPNELPGFGTSIVWRSKIETPILTGYDTILLRAFTHQKSKVDQFSCLVRERVVGKLFKVGNECKDTMQRLMLPWPTPMPWLEIRVLGDSQEPKEEIAAICDKAFSVSVQA